MKTHNVEECASGVKKVQKILKSLKVGKKRQKVVKKYKTLGKLPAMREKSAEKVAKSVRTL